MWVSSGIAPVAATAVALATLLAATPVAVVFVVSQRALLRELVGGASKG